VTSWSLLAVGGDASDRRRSVVFLQVLNEYQVATRVKARLETLIPALEEERCLTLHVMSPPGASNPNPTPSGSAMSSRAASEVFGPVFCRP
jgi:hypothetical protein